MPYYYVAHNLHPIPGESKKVAVRQSNSPTGWHKYSEAELTEDQYDQLGSIHDADWRLENSQHTGCYPVDLQDLEDTLGANPFGD